MFKRLLLLSAAAMAHLASPAVAGAQIEISDPTCATIGVTYAFFSNATATCQGFYEGNENRGGVPRDGALHAIIALGGSAANVNLQETTSISGGTLGLTGLGVGSIVGIHWGGGNDIFKSEFPEGKGKDKFRLGTAFFRIESITGTQLILNEEWRGGYSNASKYGTVDIPVPEPTSFGLVGMGLLGLGVAARRRRA